MGRTERQRQNLTQAPGSELSAQSQMQGSSPRAVRSWPEPNLDAQPTELPKCPRTNIVKMSIVPKATYTSNAIPMKIPPAFFAELDQTILKLVWNHTQKKPCTTKAILAFCFYLSIVSVCLYILLDLFSDWFVGMFYVLCTWSIFGSGVAIIFIQSVTFSFIFLVFFSFMAKFVLCFVCLI